MIHDSDNMKNPFRKINLSYIETLGTLKKCILK